LLDEIFREKYTVDGIERKKKRQKDIDYRKTRERIYYNKEKKKNNQIAKFDNIDEVKSKKTMRSLIEQKKHMEKQRAIKKIKDKSSIATVFSPLKVGTEESKRVSLGVQDSSNVSYITDSNIGKLDVTESLQESINSSLGTSQEPSNNSSLHTNQETSNNSSPGTNQEPSKHSLQGTNQEESKYDKLR
jgi:hypothetical protein